MTSAEPADRDLGPTPGEPRRLRADAQRNRLRILEAAEQVFASDGIAVPVDVVAEHAGVGVGTLYRHFPTKEALYEAVVARRLDELAAATDPDPDGDVTEQFFSFLALVADQASLKRDLFEALAAAGVDVKSRCGDRVQELEQALDRLRQRAVDSGGLRGDVTVHEIMGLVIGACRGVDRPGMTDDDRRRVVGVVCDGLRSRR